MGETLAMIALKQKKYFELLEGLELVIEINLLENLINDWPNYNDLSVIVIGSSPADDFKSSGAFVGESQSGHIPLSVIKLKKALNSAFYESQDCELDYDYNSKHAKDRGILFINVCLTEGNKRHEVAQFTIEFINRILERKFNEGKKISILDMRLDIHSHESERRYYEENYSKDSDGYKIVNFENFHRLDRIGHPAYLDVMKITESLIRIGEFSPEIACIYRNVKDCKCRKDDELLKNDELLKDNELLKND